MAAFLIIKRVIATIFELLPHWLSAGGRRAPSGALAFSGMKK